MKLPITLGGLALGTAAVFVGHMNSDAVAARSSAAGGAAPDVIVGDVQEIIRHNSNAIDGMIAYSIGTNSCNIGNDYLTWEGNNNQHPTIGGSMYRILYMDNGCTKIEQIGRSWLKHGFCALQQTLCGSCQNSGGNGCPNRLGWNCSDPYTASLNGQQSNLGPRSEVNPTTGYFPYPPGGGSYQSTIGRRLQVPQALINAPAGTQFLVDGIYIHPDDAAACNGNNNASYRLLNKSGSNTMSFGSNQTVRMNPAIFAWEAADPSVRLTTIDLSDCNERMHFGESVCENADGTWTYIYTVSNVNIHSAVGGISVPFGGSDVPTEFEINLCPYHSGEVYADPSLDWNASVDNGMLNFSCDDFSSNPEATAILWQSLGTFSFTTDSAPTEGFLDIHLHKTGGMESVATLVPGDPVDPPTECEIADIDNDGFVDGTDLSLVLGYWSDNCGGCIADVNGDNAVDGFDLSFVLGYWNCDVDG